MMQKDEDLLLGPWIAYYGYQFGIENLTILDNGSTSERVISTLHDLEAAGGHVYWHYSSKEDWLNKGNLLTYAIKNMDRNANYDFVFPLDCDEFIALYTEGGLVCDRTSLHDYLDSLIGIKDVFNVPSWAFNVPKQPGWFYPFGVPKRFFAADTLDWMDHGYHNAVSRKSDKLFNTHLTYLHFHNKPFEVLKEHSRRKLASFVDVNDPEALLAYRGDNYLVAKNLLISENDHYLQFDEKLKFEFTGFGKLMRMLGQDGEMIELAPEAMRRPAGQPRVRLPGNASSTVPISFDPEAYLARYLDVAGSRHFALEHLVFCGHSEGRTAGYVTE